MKTIEEIALEVEEVMPAYGQPYVEYIQEFARRLIAAVDAERGKSEPVAVVDANDGGYWAEIIPNRDVKVGQELFAHPAPAIPEGWLRAVDEALVVCHLGVAEANDSYEDAKAWLDRVIAFHIDVATDPTVNGGFQLVPKEPTRHMKTKGICVEVGDEDDPFVLSWEEVTNIYKAMLAAAPQPGEK